MITEKKRENNRFETSCTVIRNKMQKSRTHGTRLYMFWSFWGLFRSAPAPFPSKGKAIKAQGFSTKEKPLILRNSAGIST